MNWVEVKKPGSEGNQGVKRESFYSTWWAFSITAGGFNPNSPEHHFSSEQLLTTSSIQCWFAGVIQFSLWTCWVGSC